MPYEFKPRPPRYRLFGNGQMWAPGEFCITADGRAITVDEFFLAHNMEQIVGVVTDGIPTQSTGLTDADGVEVFEGDILWATSYPGANRCHWVIGWDDGSKLKCGPIFMGSDPHPYPDPPHVSLHHLLEDAQALVVSNVFENPDLLP